MSPVVSQDAENLCYPSKKMLSDAVQRVEDMAQRLNVDLEGVPDLGL